MLDRLVCWWKWLGSGQCRIRDVNSQIVTLLPNASQCQLAAVLMGQALRGVPLRIVVLKARKKGVTTLVQSLLYFLCQHYERQIAVMLAHQAASTAEIFEIPKLMAKENRYLGSQIGMRILRFPDTDSRFHCHTAGSPDVAAGGTPNLLHQSEVALWPARTKAETDTVSTEAVPFVAGTMILKESTARGVDRFYEQFQSAAKPADPFTAIFIPWFINGDCVVKLDAPLSDVDADEAAIVRVALNYGIDLGHDALAWRRMKMVGIGPDKFRREYPTTPEEAVRHSRSLVLPGLAETVIAKLPFDYCAILQRDRIGGVDFGYHDPTAILSAVYWDQVLYVIGVYRRRSELADQHVNGLMEGHKYWCDPAALQARKELAAAARRRGVPVTLLKAPVANDPREALRTESAWEICRTWISTDRVRVLESCSAQLVIEGLKLGYNEVTGAVDDRRSEETGHFDTVDALRYCIMGLHRSAATGTPVLGAVAH